MNTLDILLLVLIAAAVVLAIRKIRSDRRNGKGCLSCGGNCAGCGLDCHARKEREH
ncbi:MAG: FeoB-associated Cys-rich membrane protein [Oscillospiraceae bacterium]|nr:FeoB-associated Cys-rich membrane protein [Oscillospiraceae bacterium]MBQ9250967.1 FeoB-associated Cys-rich membrane protein [Oscillospiraceae bacterium]